MTSGWVRYWTSWSQQVNLFRQQRSQDARTTVTVTLPPDTADVRGLLEAMGYRISDSQTVGADIYFLCEAKWGAEIRQEVVHFVGETPTASDIAALNDAVLSHGAARGVLLTRHPLPAPLRDLARQRERIQCYTLDEFTDRLADFRPYLERLIADYEASEIPQYYVPLSVEAEVGEDREPQVFKPIESFVDTWLAEPGRNHLSILGDFGSGKTWFCQRYAYLAAKRYLADPAHNRIPILITLRDYSRAYDVEQLITDAIANRYKVSACGWLQDLRSTQPGRAFAPHLRWFRRDGAAGKRLPHNRGQLLGAWPRWWALEQGAPDLPDSLFPSPRTRRRKP